MESLCNFLKKIIIIVSIGATVCNALKCFNCQESPYPRDCVHVATCSRGDVCYTEAVVSAGGEVVYNTGCLPIQHCPSNSTNRTIVRRYTDITTCVDCCNGDFCNNKGCGTSAIPREQRGPYCYSCEATWRGHMCNKVVICPRNSLCATHTPKDFFYVPEVVYQSSCVSKSMCSSIKRTYSNNKCKPTCCDTDFCNDGCNNSSSTMQSSTSSVIKPNNMHTSSPSSTPMSPNSASSIHSQEVYPATATHPSRNTQNASLSTILSSNTFSISSTPPTTNPSTTINITHVSTNSYVPKPFECYTSNGYEYIGSGLCLKIHRDNRLSWQDARAQCHNEGSEMVVLNTSAKYRSLEQYLDVHDKKRDFWIGGYDKFQDNRFYWVSGQPFIETDWYTFIDDSGSFAYSQPDNFSPDHTPADCVVTFPTESNRHKWYDDVCSNTRHFICQKT